MENPLAIERIFEDDKRVRPQTIIHHKARYEFACKYKKPKGIALDLACGTGYGSEMLRKAGYYVCGIDIDKKTIEDDKLTYPYCNFYLGDLTEMLLVNSNANLIVMFEAIEHIPYRKGLKVLEKVYDSLAKDGVFIVSTPKDINDKYNRTHKSEWPYHILKNELGSLFSDVRIYGQDWDTSIIDENNVRDNDFYIAVCKK